MPSRQTIFTILGTALAALVILSWLESRADTARLNATIAAQKQIIAAADSRERDNAAALKTTLDQIASVKRDTQSPAQILQTLPQYLPLPESIRLANSTTTTAPAPAPATAQQGTAVNQTPRPPRSLSPSPSPTSSASPPSRISNLKSEIFHFAFRYADQPAPSTAITISQISVSSNRRGIHAADSPAILPVAGLRSGVPGTPASPTMAAAPALASDTSAGTTETPAGQTSAPDANTSADAVIPAADLKPLFDYVQDCRACQARLATSQSNLRDEQTRSAALTQERDAAITAAKGGTFWRRLKRNATWLAVGAAAGALLAHTI